MNSRTALIDLPRSIFGMTLVTESEASAELGDSEVAVRMRAVPPAPTPSDSWYLSVECNEAGIPHTEVRTLDNAAALWAKAVDHREQRLGVGREAGVPALYWIAYSDGPRFVIDRSGREITIDQDWCRRDPDLVRAYLLGPIASFALRLRGTLVLHAGVVDIGGRSLALCGKQGAGKSTTTTALATRRARLVSEDVAALVDNCNGQGFRVEYGPAQVRLWPSSIDALFGPDAVAAARPLHPTSDKRLVELRAKKPSDDLAPLPLAAVYVLAARRPTIMSPTIEPIAGREAVLALVPHTRQNQWLSPELRRRELAALTKLVESTPIRRLKVPYDLQRLDELCGAIEDDFDAVTGSKPAPRRW